MAEIGRYPGVASGVAGIVVVHPTTHGVHFSGLLTGLQASTSGGYHVHTGYGGCPAISGADFKGPSAADPGA